MIIPYLRITMQMLEGELAQWLVGTDSVDSADSYREVHSVILLLLLYLLCNTFFAFLHSKTEVLKEQWIIIPVVRSLSVPLRDTVKVFPVSQFLKGRSTCSNN